MPLLFPLLLACAEDCPAGTHEDGPVCVADPAETAVDGIAVPLRACTPTTGDGDIDLANTCVGDLCVGDTYADAVAALGTPADFMPWVEWPSGLGIGFDPDGEPPPDEAAAVEFWVESPYPGRTTNGLGAGVAMQCFLDELGLPDDVSLSVSGSSYVVWYIHWDAPDLMVFDDDVLFGEADSIVDTLTFEAP